MLGQWLRVVDFEAEAEEEEVVDKACGGNAALRWFEEYRRDLMAGIELEKVG